MLRNKYCFDNIIEWYFLVRLINLMGVFMYLFFFCLGFVFIFWDIFIIVFVSIIV